MRAILKFYLLYWGLIILALWLSSCSPANQARRLVRQAYTKLEKAKRLDPSVVDSINRKQTVYIEVPADSGEIKFTPQLDPLAFQATIENYDSTLLVIDSLNRVLKSGNISKATMEQALSKQQKLIQSLKLNRERLMQGFAKDTIYYFSDSLVQIGVMFDKGRFQSIHYFLKERMVSKDVTTTQIKFDGARIIQPYRQTWFWIMACLILVLLLVILVSLRRK